MSIPRNKSLLRVFPLLTVCFFLLPIGVGLIGTWLPAFGYLPVIGAKSISLAYFFDFWDYPGIFVALRSTLISGVGASLLALGMALWLTMHLHGTRVWTWIERGLAPLLAIPHAAFAIGFALLVTPSGLLLRLFSPVLTGFEMPPDYLIVGDRLGLSLLSVLAIKEVPFFLLMIIGVLSQLHVSKIVWLGRSLGYCRARIWGRLIIPQLYPHLRLPFFAVLAYSLSVVDIALIAGPSLPPTLAVLINYWFYSPDMEYRLLGSAGATSLCFLVCLAILVCLVFEKVFTYWCRIKIVDGSRYCLSEKLRLTGYPLIFLFSIAFVGSISALFVQSVAKRWRFPETFPTTLSLQYWQKGMSHAQDPLLTTIVIGLVAVFIAIVLVVGCLEYEVVLARMGRKTNMRSILWIIYIPLLVPQISFIFGIQLVAVFLNMDGTFVSMIVVHLIFVLPYVFLTLAHPYRSYDQRYYDVALGLSGSPLRALLKVKLPMLLKPIAFSMATGFTVSVVQYLPTLYVGAGRFATITTETVSLASGSDVRIASVYALLQFSLPMIVYCLALLGPFILYRHRGAMQS